jgi:hypothetical protein
MSANPEQQEQNFRQLAPMLRGAGIELAISPPSALLVPAERIPKIFCCSPVAHAGAVAARLPPSAMIGFHGAAVCSPQPRREFPFLCVETPARQI